MYVTCKTWKEILIKNEVPQGGNMDLKEFRKSAEGVQIMEDFLISCFINGLEVYKKWCGGYHKGSRIYHDNTRFKNMSKGSLVLFVGGGQFYGFIVWSKVVMQFWMEGCDKMKRKHMEEGRGYKTAHFGTLQRF